MRSATISGIDVARSDSWQDFVYITIDIDWAIDEVIDETADLIEAAGACATWFVTHDTPVISRLRKNPLWEVGIHPNFNFLLHGDPQKGRDVKEVIARLMEIVPEATAVRSHSLAQGSLIHAAFVATGLTHDCNDLIPCESGIILAPWIIPSGLIKVPHFWEDDVCFSLQVRPKTADLSRLPGLKVFDFHPIHVCLNSAEHADYEKARPHFQDYDALRNLRNGSIHGSRSSMTSLLEVLV